VILKGIIQDIEYSHTIGDVEYEKANVIVRNSNGKQSILTLQFKKFSGNVKDGEYVSLVGNIRSYSRKISENKNKVNVYVFTYFDVPDDKFCSEEIENQVLLDGRICKLEPLRKLQDGKCNIHFILANNIEQNGNKLNSYIPCIAWGKTAKQIAELSKNDKLAIVGELRSREYKKPLQDGEFEIRVAHELVVSEILQEAQ
jgi:hypothetical protein